MKRTNRKQNRLCGQERIQALYKEGKRFSSWPVRVTYRQIDAPSEVLVWAPKSLFHHAVDRNRLRRQMREVWRLDSDQVQYGYEIAFNYMDKEMRPYEQIRKGMVKAMERIAQDNHGKTQENH